MWTDGLSPDRHDHRQVIEMKALIRLCETTDSIALKMAAKRRLKTLSEIPAINPYADRIVGK